MSIFRPPFPNLGRHFTLAVLAALLVAGCSQGGLRKPLKPTVGVRSPAFEHAMGAALGGTFLPGNRITTLNNGDEIFPAMLAAIRSARRTINFETFVFYKGEIPGKFAEALAERARAGVEVRIIFDAVGAAKSRGYWQQLRDAGAQVAIYHPVFWWDLRRYNNRTHRKLLIVDGRVAFIGGVGVADEWKGNARTPEEWRELHYRAEGPVVAQFQGAFQDNWLKTRHEILQGPEHFPALKSAGPARAAIFHSSPRRGRYSVDVMYHLAIASARESILITSPYFIPDDELVEALCAAARRGVRVRIIMPGEHIDQPAVRRASRKRWPKLRAAGVELFEFRPTMIHSKLLIVDEWFVSVGSANFDPRSIELNDEANLNVLDRAFAREQTRIFERDLRRAQPAEHGRDAATQVAEAPVQVLETPLEPQL